MKSFLSSSVYEHTLTLSNPFRALAIYTHTTLFHSSLSPFPHLLLEKKKQALVAFSPPSASSTLPSQFSVHSSEFCLHQIFFLLDSSKETCMVCTLSVLDLLFFFFCFSGEHIYIYTASYGWRIFTR